MARLWKLVLGLMVVGFVVLSGSRLCQVRIRMSPTSGDGVGRQLGLHIVVIGVGMKSSENVKTPQMNYGRPHWPTVVENTATPKTLFGWLEFFLSSRAPTSAKTDVVADGNAVPARVVVKVERTVMWIGGAPDRAIDHQEDGGGHVYDSSVCRPCSM